MFTTIEVRIIMCVVDFNSSLGFGDKHIGADAKKVENVQNLGY